MLSLIQNALRFVYQVTLQPDVWTVEEPSGVRGTGQPSQTGKWARVMVEVPVLQSKMAKIDSHTIQAEATLQYRAVFRFPGNLRYDQLPMSRLTDISQYISFVLQSHPSLLSSSPQQVQQLLNWQYPHVDKCLYPTDQPTTDAEKALADLTINRVEVNSFIPIVELEGSDWLVIMVWSIQLRYEVGMNTIRQYWIDSLDVNQVFANPNLTGGLLDLQPWQVGLALRKKITGTPTDPASHTPVPGQL
jgi:hypothetical protein